MMKTECSICNKQLGTYLTGDELYWRACAFCGGPEVIRTLHVPVPHRCLWKNHWAEEEDDVTWDPPWVEEYNAR